VVITHDHEIADSLPRQVAVRDGIIESDSALALQEVGSLNERSGSPGLPGEPDQWSERGPSGPLRSSRSGKQ
jgi:hypothetical protein